MAGVGAVGQWSFRGALALLGWLTFGLLLLPFATLLRHLSPSALQAALNQGGWQAAGTSLEAALLAVGLIVLLGTPLAYLLARHRFFGKTVVETLLYVPLVTPPLVTGLLLVSVFGPYAFLGRLLGGAGLAFSDVFPGLVLAGFYVASPYYILSARSALEAVDPALEWTSALLGRGRWFTLARITLPLAKPGLLTGLALAWARAIGEFGATIILAYHPYGLPVQIWVDLNAAGLEPALATAAILLALAVPLPLGFTFWERRRRA